MNEPRPESEAERGRNPIEQPQRPVPSIYVTSLSDYNAGRLHGAWIDAARSTGELAADIAAMLARSRVPRAEEWAIHDYDGFGPLRLGEFESLDIVTAVGRGIAQHGEAFAAWASRLSPLSVDNLDGFEDAYRGCWESVDAYAEDLLDSLGATEVLDELPEWLRSHVQLDVVGFARELRLAGDILTFDGNEGTHVFDGSN